MPSGRAGRPDAVSSVAPIALLSGLPASLPPNVQHTPTTNGVPPIPPTAGVLSRPVLSLLLTEVIGHFASPYS